MWVGGLIDDVLMSTIKWVGLTENSALRLGMCARIVRV